MKHSTKTFVLEFVAAVMVGMPCIARDVSQSAWKKLSDMAVPQMVPRLSRGCGCAPLPDLPLSLVNL